MAIEELDYDHRIHGGQSADQNLAVKFYLEALRNDDESAIQGRPIFQDTEFIEIRVRGDRNNVVQRPARPEDKRRFRDAYVAFKDGEEEALKGTPLKDWPPMTRSLVEELKYMGFHTVEQLSEASDSVCAKMAGLQTYKQKAKVFLEVSKGTSAPIETLTARLGEVENERDSLKISLEEMADRLKALEAKAKK